MKSILIITGIFLFCNASYGQEANAILGKSFEKCQSIQNGYYEMTSNMKFMSEKDTFKTTFYCHFKKLKEDSLFSSAFHFKTFWNDTSLYEVMYTGDELVTADSDDSTATIMSKTQWAEEIKSIAHNYKFYTPLTSKKSSPIQHDSDFINTRYSFKFFGEEKINDALCYHIQVNKEPDNDSTEMMKTIRQEYHYWINKNDYLPIQYSIAYDLVMNNDTMYQFEKIVLNKYEINNLTNDNILTLNSIPDYYKQKDYVPYKSPELLKKDTIAPDWELYSLTDEKISLNSLKGQLVLIDFFYKACYPCMQALPALQALSEKYKSKGLRVIGIDPYDKKEDDISSFLTKRGVTYTVLLGGKETAKDYHVSGYPTMYLIDRTGKIIFRQVGYGKDVDNILDDIIVKNL